MLQHLSGLCLVNFVTFKYKALYLYSVCNFISKNNLSVCRRNYKRIVEFAENTNRATFMNIHIVHGFHNFRQSEHPFNGVSVSLSRI